MMGGSERIKGFVPVVLYILVVSAVVAAAADEAATSNLNSILRYDSTLYPFSINSQSSSTRYYQDAPNLLADLSSFDAIYIQYHSCAMAPTSTGNAELDEVDEDDYWYMGASLSVQAQVTYSLYGVSTRSSDSGSGSSGSSSSSSNAMSKLWNSLWGSYKQYQQNKHCASATFLNSFVTTSGYTAYTNALGLSTSYSASCNSAVGVACSSATSATSKNGGWRQSILPTQHYRFVYNQYSSNNGVCQSNKVSAVLDEMETLNQDLESTTCLPIYTSDTASSNTALATLLSYSSSCSSPSLFNPTSVCPDPYGHLASRESKLYAQYPATSTLASLSASASRYMASPLHRQWTSFALLGLAILLTLLTLIIWGRELYKQHMQQRWQRRRQKQKLRQKALKEKKVKDANAAWMSDSGTDKNDKDDDDDHDTDNQSTSAASTARSVASRASKSIASFVASAAAAVPPPSSLSPVPLLRRKKWWPFKKGGPRFGKSGSGRVVQDGDDPSHQYDDYESFDTEDNKNTTNTSASSSTIELPRIVDTDVGSSTSNSGSNSISGDGTTTTSTEEDASTRMTSQSDMEHGHEMPYESPASLARSQRSIGSSLYQGPKTPPRSSRSGGTTAHQAEYYGPSHHAVADDDSSSVQAVATTTTGPSSSSTLQRPLPPPSPVLLTPKRHNGAAATVAAATINRSSPDQSLGSHRTSSSNKVSSLSPAISMHDNANVSDSPLPAVRSRSQRDLDAAAAAASSTTSSSLTLAARGVMSSVMNAFMISEADCATSAPAPPLPSEPTAQQSSAVAATIKEDKFVDATTEHQAITPQSATIASSPKSHKTSDDQNTATSQQGESAASWYAYLFTGTDGANTDAGDAMSPEKQPPSPRVSRVEPSQVTTARDNGDGESSGVNEAIEPADCLRSAIQEIACHANQGLPQIEAKKGTVQNFIAQAKDETRTGGPSLLSKAIGTNVEDATKTRPEHPSSRAASSEKPNAPEEDSNGPSLLTQLWSSLPSVGTGAVVQGATETAKTIDSTSPSNANQLKEMNDSSATSRNVDESMNSSTVVSLKHTVSRLKNREQQSKLPSTPKRGSSSLLVDLLPVSSFMTTTAADKTTESAPPTPRSAVVPDSTALIEKKPMPFPLPDDFGCLPFHTAAVVLDDDVTVPDATPFEEALFPVPRSERPSPGRSTTTAAASGTDKTATAAGEASGSGAACFEAAVCGATDIVQDDESTGRGFCLPDAMCGSPDDGLCQSVPTSTAGATATDRDNVNAFPDPPLAWNRISDDDSQEDQPDAQRFPQSAALSLGSLFKHTHSTSDDVVATGGPVPVEEHPSVGDRAALAGFATDFLCDPTKANPRSLVADSAEYQSQLQASRCDTALQDSILEDDDKVGAHAVGMFARASPKASRSSNKAGYSQDLLSGNPPTSAATVVRPAQMTAVRHVKALGGTLSGEKTTRSIKPLAVAASVPLFTHSKEAQPRTVVPSEKERKPIHVRSFLSTMQHIKDDSVPSSSRTNGQLQQQPAPSNSDNGAGLRSYLQLRQGSNSDLVSARRKSRSRSRTRLLDRSGDDGMNEPMGDSTLNERPRVKAAAAAAPDNAAASSSRYQTSSSTVVTTPRSNRSSHARSSDEYTYSPASLTATATTATRRPSGSNIRNDMPGSQQRRSHSSPRSPTKLPPLVGTVSSSSTPQLLNENVANQSSSNRQRTMVDPSLAPTSRRPSTTTNTTSAPKLHQHGSASSSTARPGAAATGSLPHAASQQSGQTRPPPSTSGTEVVFETDTAAATNTSNSLLPFGRRKHRSAILNRMRGRSSKPS